MIEFDFNGIRVETTAYFKSKFYYDYHNSKKDCTEREVHVAVHFWNFGIIGDLYELAFVKSTLQYFMSCYWKRTSKEGSRIEFEKELEEKKKQAIDIYESRINIQTELEKVKANKKKIKETI